MHKNICYKFISFCLLIGILFSSFPSTAATEDELLQQAEERKSLKIQSNEIPNWPTGPEIGAEAAILMEAGTGTILYAKNINEKLYPASTTKMLTCLVAVENSTLDEMVDFSYDAVHSIPVDGSNMGIDAGQSLPMEECLYGIMVASANEVASAVAEHVGGTIDNFVDMMNQKAAELGCTDSHFVNSNGLYDDDHYTSAYDLALIAKAFFSNDLLRRIGNTDKYHFIATDTQPDDFYKTNKHKLITGEIPYEGVIGGKTGYTDEARQTLVTGCEQNGLRLICVVLKEEAPAQFEDTVALFNYGFQNFSKVNIEDNDTSYLIGGSRFFQTGNDIFGNSSPFLTVAKNDYVILPNMSSFEDLTSNIDYEDPTLSENEIAKVTYYYQDVPIGTTKILLSEDAVKFYDFHSVNTRDEFISGRPDNVIFINIRLLLISILVLAGICILILIIHSLFHDRRLSRQERVRRKRLRKEEKRRNRERRRSRSFERKRFRKRKRRG